MFGLFAKRMEACTGKFFSAIFLATMSELDQLAGAGKFFGVYIPKLFAKCKLGKARLL
jgi:hypothetical protein